MIFEQIDAGGDRNFSYLIGDEESRLCAVVDPGYDTSKLEARVKELGLAGKGSVRVNQAGCMDRCEEGPVLVVYPEGVWYTYVDEHDVDEIIDEHLVHGRIVERLRI